MSSSHRVTRAPAEAPVSRARPPANRTGRLWAHPRLRQRRWRSLVLATPGIALLGVHSALFGSAFVDDSYIFYRYAANWAHGLGPVFNRGEWVEGFSSFLWTAALALGDWLGIGPEHAAPVLAFVLAVGCLWLLASCAMAMFPQRPAVAVALPVALAACAGFAFYAISGMDTLLFTTVLLGAVMSVARYVEAGPRTPRVSVPPAALLVVLVLVRAEGCIYAIAIVLTALAILTRREGGRGREGLALLAVALTSTLVVFAVRRAVYHAWLPAPVSAKGYATYLLTHADALRLARVVGAGVLYELWLLPALALIAAALLLQLRRRLAVPPVVLIAVVVIGLEVAISVWNGGDWMPGGRLLVAALPLIFLAGAWSALAFAETRHAGHRRRMALPAAAALAAAALIAAHAQGTASDPAAGTFTALGRLLAASPHPLRLLTNVNGAVSYYAGPRTYIWDELGLTDSHNARGLVFSRAFGRTDPRYTYTRNFDLYVTNSPYSTPLMFREFRRAPARFAQYLVLTRKPQWVKLHLWVFVRRGAAIVGPLTSYCGCSAVALTPSTMAEVLVGTRTHT